MENSDSVQRGMYFPMEALPRDILSRLGGNVRVLVVPKERSSSFKENDGDCFGKTEERNVFEDDSDWMMAEKNKPRSPPVSPEVSYRKLGQVYDFRMAPGESERFPIKERQEPEHLKKLSETTPKRLATEGLQTPLRFENKMAVDENGNQTPHKMAENERVQELNISEKIKRQLFSGYESNYRFMRNDTKLHRSKSESHDDVFLDRPTDGAKVPMYFSYVEKRSPVPEVSRSFFDRDYLTSNNPSTSTSWSHYPTHQPYFEHRHCDCMERHSRHNDICRDSLESSKKRKFGDISTSENIPDPPQTKRLKCTCAMMEQNFLQMAEAAYKNIRRKDTSPSSFEQFRRELTQTNDILKDSVNILSTIRDMCEHHRKGLR